MNRKRIVGSAIFLCGFLVGCDKETREGLVTDTISRIQLAGSEVGLVTNKIKEATAEAKKTGKKLDLKEAIKQAEKLKETGGKIVEIKQRIDALKEKVSDEEKKGYARDQKDNLNRAFVTLLQQQHDLQDALDAAETVDKTKTDELRRKITEAMSPFEAQAKSAVKGS